MNQLIKSTRLHNPVEIGEYLIDPGKSICVSMSRGFGPEQSPEDKAALIIEDAQAEAAGIIATAEAQANRIRESAYQEGLQAGIEQVEDQKRELAGHFSNLNSDAQAKIEEFWSSIEPEIVGLSIDIARKIVRKRIEEDDEFILDTVKAGIRQLREKQDLKVRVNPADYQYMREHKEDVLASSDGIKTIEIIDDRRVDQGGAIIESGCGHLDARIATQFGEIEKAMKEAADYGKSDSSTDA